MAAPPPPPHRHHGYSQTQQTVIEMIGQHNQPTAQNEPAGLGFNIAGTAMKSAEEGPKQSKMDEDKDDYLNFDYYAVFEQHPQSRLAPQYDEIARKFYNKTRQIWYQLLVFILGLPWMCLMACVNASLMYSYSWCMSPIAKLIKFCLAVSSHSSYKVIAILCQPLGNSMHKCITNYCGGRCGKHLRGITKVVKDASKAVENGDD